MQYFQSLGARPLLGRGSDDGRAEARGGGGEREIVCREERGTLGTLRDKPNYQLIIFIFKMQTAEIHR